MSQDEWKCRVTGRTFRSARNAIDYVLRADHRTDVVPLYGGKND